MNKLQPVYIKNVSIKDSFWSGRLDINQDVTIPYQYQMCRKTGRIDAFKLDWNGTAAKKTHIFWDSDVGKWLEAVAYVLACKSDNLLEKKADAVIDIIAAAQQTDGYLNTYFTSVEPENRWTNLRDNHELYCAGHLIEAAVAYFENTGKEKFLKVICRYADYICSVFGPEKGKLKGYAGHPEIELALVKLYRVSGCKKYLSLAVYFIEQRGNKPVWFEKEIEAVQDFTGTISDKHYTADYSYNQAHLPVRLQKTAEGHAVRACYLYSAIADIAYETEDKSLLTVCTNIWNDIVSNKVYVTGGIGSTDYSERFTIDGDLPNYEAFSETCASIALVFFSQRMFYLTMDSRYADLIERALYNTICGSVGIDGKSFFYANALEEWPEKRKYQLKYQGKKYSHSVRQQWYDTSCCPPNIARLFASLGSYIYSNSPYMLFVNLYISSKVTIKVDGQDVTLNLKTKYPYDGRVSVKVEVAVPLNHTIALRIPGWCSRAELKINGRKISLSKIVKKGYVILKRMWVNYDHIELNMDMPVVLVTAHPKVVQAAGKAAIQKGPLIYCLEGIDNSRFLNDIVIPEGVVFKVVKGKIISQKTQFIHFNAYKRLYSSGSLYSTCDVKLKKVKVKAIPYYLRANRSDSEMLVWINDGRTKYNTKL